MSFSFLAIKEILISFLAIKEILISFAEIIIKGII
jgi:hypothetical protein